MKKGRQKGGLFRPFVLIIFSVLLIAPSFCKAEKEFLLPGKLYPSLCICFPNNKEGWIAGHFGMIWHTDDGGKSWKIQESGTRKNIVDMYFVDTKNGWAVGYGGLILHTSDGKRWEKQKSPLPYFWKSVFFKDKLHGWIVGEMGTVLYTEDGGKNWKVLITGDDLVFHSIAFSPEGYGWAAGEFGVIYAYDLKKWYLEDNGIAAEENTIWSIACIGKERIVASGIASLLLIKEGYTGRWKRIRVLEKYHGQNSLFRILKFKDKIITFGMKSIYYSKDPYGPWKKARLPLKLPYGEWLYDCWNNGKRVWILGIKGTILYSDDGVVWKTIGE